MTAPSSEDAWRRQVDLQRHSLLSHSLSAPGLHGGRATHTRARSPIALPPVISRTITALEKVRRVRVTAVVSSRVVAMPAEILD